MNKRLSFLTLKILMVFFLVIYHHSLFAQPCTPCTASDEPAPYLKSFNLVLDGVSYAYGWVGSGNFVTNCDGTASLSGTIAQSGDPTCEYAVSMTFGNGQASSDYQSNGGNLINQAGVSQGQLDDWYIFELTSGSMTGVSGGCHDGEVLSLAHDPPSMSVGFQMGEGGGVHTTSMGFGGWFSIAGSRTGSGDINVILSCSACSNPPEVGPISGPPSVCVDESVVYEVEAIANATAYNWTLPSGWTITSGAGTNSITVVSDGSADGQICLTVDNDCGTSEPVCIEVINNPQNVELSDIMVTVTTPCVGAGYGLSIDENPNLTSVIWTSACGPVSSKRSIYEGTLLLPEDTCTVCAVGVTDCGFTDPVCIDIYPLESDFSTSVIVGDETCALNDGSISVMATTSAGGSFSFSIDGGDNVQGSSTFTGLSAGLYDVWAYYSLEECPDHYGQVIINAPTGCDGGGCDISGTATPTDVPCGGFGSITINASGTGGTLEYSIDNVDWQSSNTFTIGYSNAGDYMTYARYTDGTCITQLGLVTVNRQDPANCIPDCLFPISASIGATRIPCDGTGATITVYLASSMGQVVYSLDNVNFQYGNEFYGITTPGMYTVYMQNADASCPTSQNVNVELEQNCCNLITTIPKTDVSCDGDDGTITVNVTGTNGAVQYSIDGGSTWSSNNYFDGLSVGSYTVVVKDSDCTTLQYIIQINETYQNCVDCNVVIADVVKTDETCFGDDGSITITASGEPNLLYSIDGGLEWFADNVFTGLSVGLYDVMVRSANCWIPYSTQIMISPASGCGCVSNLTIDNVVVKNETACNLLNGSIIITASTTPASAISYSIDGGLTYSTSGTFSNLAPGVYSIVVKDLSDCPEVYGIVKIIPADCDDLGTIGNYVWLDENQDAAQDAGERGIPGVLVELWRDTNNDGARDFLYGTKSTDFDGKYVFPNLPAGTYFVDIVESSIPENMFQTQTTSLDNRDFHNKSHYNEGYQIFLAAGEEEMSADFGYYYGFANAPIGNGAIGDRVWVDANGDEIQNFGEIGLEGVELCIYYDSDMNGIVQPGIDALYTGAVDYYGHTGGKTETNAAGYYVFNNLMPGIYIVKLCDPTQVSSYSQTFDIDGTLDHSTNQLLILPGDFLQIADFGYEPTGTAYTIGDLVYFDGNANGIFDDDDYGLTGVSLSLYKNGQFAAGTYTNAVGQYQFAGLEPGNYKVIVTDGEHVLDNLRNTGDPDGGMDGVGSLAITTASNSLQDFGYTVYDHISGRGLFGDQIFLDRDGNGMPNPNEGIEGVEVELFNLVSGLVEATTTTNEFGYYYFGDQNWSPPIKIHQIRVVGSTLPSGLQISVDPDGTLDGLTLPDISAANPVELSYDFGYVPTTGEEGSIGDLVWYDVNADALHALTGENGLPFVTLDLYLDANNNGYIDSGDAKVGTAITNFSGNYLFSNLPTNGASGNQYLVKVTDQLNLLEGAWHSLGLLVSPEESKPDPYLTAISSASPDVDIADFGYYIDPASLGNYVWEDLNANGVQDALEPAIPNVLVQLDVIVDGLPPVEINMITKTDVNGYYEFEGLLYDEDFNGLSSFQTLIHQISVVSPSGMTPTYVDVGMDDFIDSEDPSGVIAYPLQGTTNVFFTNDTEGPASYDFGFVNGATIGNYLWLDDDRDGTQNESSTNFGVNGVLVKVVGAGPDAIFDTADDYLDQMYTITNGGTPGFYEFDVPPGDYAICLYQGGGHVLTGVDLGGDDDKDSDIALGSFMSPVVSLAGGDNDPSIDIGLVLESVIFPVELLDFIAYEEKCRAFLEWKTATEINVSHFEIETSTDGTNYRNIGIVEAAGNSTEVMHYQFSYENLQRVNYFRLKIIDQDGSYEYSDAVIVYPSCGEENYISSLYPNPYSTGNIKAIVSISSAFEQPKMVVFDVLGRKVHESDIVLEIGTNIIQTNLSHLANGMYSMRIISDSLSTKPLKFVKID